MLHHILHQTIQQHCSESFRQIYEDPLPYHTLPNQNPQPSSPSKICIQYEKQPTPHAKLRKPKLKKQPDLHSKPSSTPSDDTIKRLHASNKKYSFSIFVKKYKKYETQRKTQTQSLQESAKLLKQQKKAKGFRQINSVIRTMYDNFRKFQNMSKRSEASKSSRTSPLTNQKPTSFNQQSFRKTARQTTKVSLNHSPSYQEKSASLQENPTSRTRASFIKTLTFGEKLQHSRELQNFRTNNESRGYLTLGRAEIPFLSHQDTQYDPSSFLKIQKLSLQKKQQQFFKNTIDFKDIMLRDRLEKDNKIKAEQIMKAFSNDKNGFLKYAETVRENKYVSEMRGIKKTKKKWTKEREQDSFRNKISPW